MTPLQEPELPPSLRLLKHLVTVLTITMIVGVITVVGVLVTRMPRPEARPALPPGFTLPAGATAQAVTFGTGWIAVVTQQNHILIYDPDGKLLQDVTIVPSSP